MNIFEPVAVLIYPEIIVGSRKSFVGVRYHSVKAFLHQFYVELAELYNFL